MTASEATPAVTIPAELLPQDGRFGAGPSSCRRCRTPPACWAPPTARSR